MTERKRKRPAIFINTNGVADHYAAPNAKIVEYSSPVGGGLIAFRLCPNLDGTQTLVIDTYRADGNVVVNGVKQ